MADQCEKFRETSMDKVPFPEKDPNNDEEWYGIPSEYKEDAIITIILGFIGAAAFIMLLILGCGR